MTKTFCDRCKKEIKYPEKAYPAEATGLIGTCGLTHYNADLCAACSKHIAVKIFSMFGGYDLKPAAEPVVEIPTE